MEQKVLHRFTALFIFISVLLIIISQVYISTNFSFSDYSTEDIFNKYHEGGSLLRIVWCLFALGSFLIIPISIMLQKVLLSKNNVMLKISATFGVIAGFSYVLGIMRWVLLANVLTDRYIDPNTSMQAKEGIEIIFKAFDSFLGNSMGETIAPIAHGVWIGLIGIIMLRTHFLSRWLAWTQIIGGLIIIIRPLEYVGFKAVAEISDYGLMVWSLTFVYMGIKILCMRKIAGGGEMLIQ